MKHRVSLIAISLVTVYLKGLDEFSHPAMPKIVVYSLKATRCDGLTYLQRKGPSKADEPKMNRII